MTFTKFNTHTRAHVPASAPAHYATARVYMRARNNCVMVLCDCVSPKELWVCTIASLECGKSEKRKSRIERVVIESFEEIVQFLRTNEESLRLKEADGSIKPLTTRRIQDLAAYRDCTLGNFRELFHGLFVTTP
jgi:hypothetical protein